MTDTKVTNPYSGQSEVLTPEEFKLYWQIKIAEHNEDVPASPDDMHITPCDVH